MRFAAALMLMLVCVQISAARQSIHQMCNRLRRTSCGPWWWRFDGGRCLRFNNSLKATFANAQYFCHRQNSELVSIHSDAERDHVSCLVYYGLKKPEQVWIGAVRQKRGRGFRWTDGSRFNYSSWAPGEPNNINEKCVVTNFLGYGKWNDIRCRIRYKFVCAKK